MGRHIVRVEGHDQKVEFTLEKGQEVFVRFDVDSAFFGKGIYPVVVNRATALMELKRSGQDVDHVKCSSE